MSRALALLLVALAAGCYRGAPPPPLPEGVAIDIVTHRGRLVRSQAALQAELAAAFSRDLGWSVAPTGGARFALVVAEEDFEVAASGDLGIPERWRVTLRGDWTLESPTHGRLAGEVAADGFYRDRFEQSRAVQQAARSAAADVVSELRFRLATDAAAADR